MCSTFMCILGWTSWQFIYQRLRVSTTRGERTRILVGAVTSQLESSWFKSLAMQVLLLCGILSLCVCVWVLSAFKICSSG